MQRQTFDREKVSLEIARLKKGSQNFEIAVNPGLALDYKNRRPVEIRDILVSEKVFSDARKGMLASEHEMVKVFGTSDPLEVAKQILDNGDVHLTAEYRERITEEKRNRIIGIIQTNGIDPRTKLPHPRTRIENAFAEAKIRIDERRSCEDQLDDIIKALRPILPIKFEVERIQVELPAKYAGNLHSIAKGFGRIASQEWHSDGSCTAVVEVPGGLAPDFYDRLNSLTHGNAASRQLEN